MRRPAGLDGALLALAALVVVSTGVRFASSRGVAAPWIAPDEQLYGLLGRSLAAGDGLRLLGEPVPFYSLLYPSLVGLPALVAGVAGTVTAVQALQALLMSATAIPVFLWARPVAGARFALAAAALTVLVPGLVYSGLLMSEALYYPVAVVATWALATCLRDPSVVNQALLLGAVAVALATRLQAVGFVAVVLVALALLALFERSGAPFRRLVPTLAVLGVAGSTWVGVRVALGGAGEVVGAYAPLVEASAYSLSDVGRTLAWQAGALALLTFGIPLVALGVLAWEALRGRERDPHVRALVAAAGAYLAVTLVEVSVFASRFVEHVTERQLLSVAPPAFVALAVWLHRGAPRPQPATSILALGIAASTLLLPLERVATPAAAPDAPSSIPLEQLGRRLSPELLELAYAGPAALVLLLAVLIPRRAAPLLAGIVAAGLAAASISASAEVRERSRIERETTFAGAPTNWIDASGARDVALLVTGDRPWPSVWHHLFWNDSLAEVLVLPDAELLGPLPQGLVAFRGDGRLATTEGDLRPAYLVAPVGISFVGEQVATLPASADQPGMAMWRVDPPVRATLRVFGLRPNGDVHGGDRAEIQVFACRPGRLELTLLGKQGLPTRLLADGEVVVERAVPPGGVWRPSVPTPASADGSDTCVYRLETDGLVGSTRIEFVPG